MLRMIWPHLQFAISHTNPAESLHVYVHRVGQQEDWTRILRPLTSGSKALEPPPKDDSSNG